MQQGAHPEDRLTTKNTKDIRKTNLLKNFPVFLSFASIVLFALNLM